MNALKYTLKLDAELVLSVDNDLFTPILLVKGNGDILARGKHIATDEEIVTLLREWVVAARALQEKRLGE